MSSCAAIYTVDDLEIQDGEMGNLARREDELRRAEGNLAMVVRLWGRATVTFPRRFAVGLLALCLGCVWFVCGQARADLLLASGHGVFIGLSGGSSSDFEREVGKHSAVDGVFAIQFRGHTPEWEVAAHARQSSAYSRPVPAPAQQASMSEQGSYLQMAEFGVARAERLWRNKRLSWYDSRLGDHERYPLATIWDATPLFETLSAIEIAAPSSAHRAALTAFAVGAERYFDATLRPTPGFAPYPGDRGQTQVWFDDNGWWGLAFLDAYRATGTPRYLRDAKRAFAFLAGEGWNKAGGGLWWNTSHPYLAGEPLAAGSLLGAQLFKLTGRSSYRDQVVKFLSWGDTSFLTELRLYKRTGFDPTPTPYIEGTLVEAHQVLCEAGIGEACARAAQLADASAERFSDRLNMGPQFDTIYLHWMLVYGAQTGDQRWRALATEMATNAQAHATNAQGLYLGAWDGTPITAHQARPNMLQTDAATLELFAWLGAIPG